MGDAIKANVTVIWKHSTIERTKAVRSMKESCIVQAEEDKEKCREVLSHTCMLHLIIFLPVGSYHQAWSQALINPDSTAIATSTPSF
jgi:hypothetical protein